MCVACKCLSVMAISMTYLRRIYAVADFSQERQRSRGPSNRCDDLLTRWFRGGIHQPRRARMHQRRAELKVRRWRGWTEASGFEVSRPSKAPRNPASGPTCPAERPSRTTTTRSLRDGMNPPGRSQALGRYLEMMVNQHSVLLPGTGGPK